MRRSNPILDLARRLASAIGLADGKPPIGASTRRSAGLSAGDWLYAQRLAERWFGPYNPTHVPDWVLKRMATDWSIGFAREIWCSAFFSVGYYAEGGDPKIRAFVEEVVNRHLAQWVEVLLRSLDYGRQACELCWEIDDVAFAYAAAEKPGEGEEVAATLADAYVLGELRDLDPERVEILADEKTGDYRGLRYGDAELPGAKTLLVTNEPEFGGLLGRALNVRAYNPWWWCNLVYLGLNRYLERKGDPPIIGFAPGEEVSDSAGRAQSPVHATAIGLANLRSGGAFVFPQEFDPDSKQPLYAVRALEVAERAPEFLSTIDRYENNKRLAWLIPGSLGSGASFASDKVSQQLVHCMFDRRLQRLILDPLNKHVIPKIVRFNFAGAKASDYPRLAAGSMAENAREVFAELLRSALQLEGVAPDGRAVKIAQMIDWAKGLRTLNLPKIDPSLIPDAPKNAPAPPSGGGFPTPGQPPSIAQESDRPNAPGRPGQASLAREDDATAAKEWLSLVQRGLTRIDVVVLKAADLVESERQSLEAEIRNLLKRALAQAKTDGDALHHENRTLAADLGRKIESLLEGSLFADLLDEKEIHYEALGLARDGSPLAEAYAQSFKAASATLGAISVSRPGKAAALRIVKDVVRDAKSNGRGVVHRETRRVTEALDRFVIGQAPTETADAFVENYELPERDFVASTVHHVRATARATLTWKGAQEQAESWLVAAAPGSEAYVLDHFPAGQVADLLWTTKTSDELDALYHGLVVDEGRPVTSWRNLGLNFGSSEMYVPISANWLPTVAALLAARRADWNRRRAARQKEIEGSGTDDDAPSTTAAGGRP